MMGPGGLSVNLIGPYGRVRAGCRLMEFPGAPSREGMVAWLNTMVADRSMVTEELIEERMTMAMQDGVVDAAIKIFSSFRTIPQPESALDPGIDPGPTPPWLPGDAMTGWMPLEGGLLGYRQLPNAELHVFANCGHLGSRSSARMSSSGSSSNSCCGRRR